MFPPTRMFPIYYHEPRLYRIGPFTTSETELKEIAKSWFAISLAFAIVYAKGSSFAGLVLMLATSAVTVGLGFMFHEFSHKIVAQRFGCFAEYRGSDQMLLLAVVMAFAGFIFAAPGAVLIAGPVDWRRNGVISAAGPAANLMIAGVFYVLYLIFGGGLGLVFHMGYGINAWLALFNLIPVWNLDGRKVLYWSKPVYFVLVAFSVVFSFILG
jgi:Zn-dependent protease